MKNCKTCQQIYDNNSRHLSYLQEAYNEGLKEAYDDGWSEGAEDTKEKMIKYLEDLPENSLIQKAITAIEKDEYETDND